MYCKSEIYVVALNREGGDLLPFMPIQALVEQKLHFLRISLPVVDSTRQDETIWKVSG
jgi:hypothetical protein